MKNANTKDSTQPVGLGAMTGSDSAKWCEPCGVERGEKCWGHCVTSKKVWMKCEVCEWQEEFSVMDVNRENCSIQFCEDCDQSRVFTLV